MEDWTNHEYDIGYMIGSITYYLNLFDTVGLPENFSVHLDPGIGSAIRQLGFGVA